MFLFTEAEQQTMQSGTKVAYNSIRTFNSSPSDCDEKTIASSFFFPTYQREFSQDQLSVMIIQNSEY